MSLEQQIDARVTLALNVCRTADGYQASLEHRTGVFSVRIAATPSAAIAAVLGEPEEPSSSVFD